MSISNICRYRQTDTQQQNGDLVPTVRGELMLSEMCVLMLVQVKYNLQSLNVAMSPGYV